MEAKANSDLREEAERSRRGHSKSMPDEGDSLRSECSSAYICQQLRKVSFNLIPYEERSYLESFFRELVYEDGFGYTLFFDKSICFSGFIQSNPASFLVEAYEYPNFKNGWQVWTKYEYLFPHPNFIFIEEDLNTNDLDKFEKENGIKISIRSLYIINKKEFIRSLTENKGIFSNVLGIHFSPLDTLKEIEESKCFTKSIHHHEGLLGILLGFGIESSMKYYQQELHLNHPFFSYTNDHLQAVGNPKIPFCPFRSIEFMGNPNSREVIEILKKNRIQREKLLEIYSKGDFLDITIQRLSEE